MCDHDRACGRGFSCDRHFGLCVPLRGEGHYCRRDAQCVRGLSCMFGKCHRSIPNGQEGKSGTANTLILYCIWRFHTTGLEITVFYLMQVPDVKLTEIAGHPCAALDTMVNKCARDAWAAAKAAMFPMAAWHSALTRFVHVMRGCYVEERVHQSRESKYSK